MNELFELLHKGHTAFGVFAIDVAVFAILMVVIYALIYLAVHKVSEILPRGTDEELVDNTPTPEDIVGEFYDWENSVENICKEYK